MRVLDRYIVAAKSLGVFPAGRAVFIETSSGYGLNNILANQVVVYDYDTGVSVGAGITMATTPRLVIAQGIDTDGDGVANVLRKPAFDFIDGYGLSAVTAEPPSMGQQKIIDVGIGCVERGKPITLTVEAKTDRTMSYYPDRFYERYSETVMFDFDDCLGCDQPLDCKTVACAIANRFNGVHDKNLSIKANGSFIRRVREHQKNDKPFTLYVLHENDYQFCFPTTTLPCVGCTSISGISGAVVDGVTYTFTGTLDPADTTKTKLSQVNSVVEQLQAIFDINNNGSVINATVYEGSAKPCDDGVKLLVNSCVLVQLLDGAGAPIAPCVGPTSVSHTLTTKGECGSCGTTTPTTFCAYLRVVPKPIKLEKFCDGPDNYPKVLYTDLRVVTNLPEDNIGKFATFVVQDTKLPKNLGYQVMHKILAQDTSANEPFSYGDSEYIGRFPRRLKGSRIDANLTGILGECGTLDSFAIVNFEHSKFNKEQFTQGDQYSPRVRTTLLVPSTNTTLKTELEGILNPWIQSSPKKFKAIDLTNDQDQTERVLGVNGTVTTEAYPNSNGKVE
jgi:hypothetical protein